MDLLSSILLCPVIVMVNQSKLSWTVQDLATRDRNINSCSRKYGQRSPCMIQFTKVKEATYRITCGAKR